LSQILANLRFFQYVRRAGSAPFRIPVWKKLRVYQIEVAQAHRFHSPRRATDIAGMAGMA
jgi:hypothetical protein